VNAYRRPDELGQVRGHRDDLGLDPETDCQRAGELFAADFREVQACGDAELRAHRLDEHRHEVGRQDNPQQHVAVLRSARDVGREVARINVGDRSDECRTQERNERAQTSGLAVERFFRRAEDSLLTG